MDPEFVRIMIRVCAIGLFIGGLGAIALVIAFRAYGTDKPREYRGALWVAGLLAFIIVGCLILLRLSFLKK